MILVDTSVWINHLRQADAALARLLNTGKVLSHPFVTGELALGSLQNRRVILTFLQNLPQATIASAQDVLNFIDQHRLFSIGIGYVDAHLLIAVKRSPGTSLWTDDKRLHAASARLGLSALPPH